MRVTGNSGAAVVRAAESRVHPHERWWSGYRRPGERKRSPKLWVARELGISSGHLSSIYSGDFRPSEELARKMAAITKGACSAKEILEWHRRNPPVWEQDKAIKKAMTARRRGSRATSTPTAADADPSKVN